LRVRRKQYNRVQRRVVFGLILRTRAEATESWSFTFHSPQSPSSTTLSTYYIVGWSLFCSYDYYYGYGYGYGYGPVHYCAGPYPVIVPCEKLPCENVPRKSSLEKVPSKEFPGKSSLEIVP
jgi:hypothetical protein